MRIRTRIERLEEEMLPPPQPPHTIRIHFVDSDGKVAYTKVIDATPNPAFVRRGRARWFTRGRGGDW